MILEAGLWFDGLVVTEPRGCPLRQRYGTYTLPMWECRCARFHWSTRESDRAKFPHFKCSRPLGMISWLQGVSKYSIFSSFEPISNGYGWPTLQSSVWQVDLRSSILLQTHRRGGLSPVNPCPCYSWVGWVYTPFKLTVAARTRPLETYRCVTPIGFLSALLVLCTHFILLCTLVQ